MTVVNSSQIVAISPAGSGTGTVSIRVTNPDGQSGQINSAYTYVTTAAPDIVSISPTAGAISGGTSVIITGTGFLPGATVRFGSTNSPSVTVNSSTRITTVTPSSPSAQTVSVRVSNTDGRNDTLSNAFTYTSGPTISAVSPNVGSTSGGSLVTITGTNFASGSIVTFDGVSATDVNVINSGLVTARTPAHAAGTVSVAVISSAGQAVRTNAYTYQAAATVTRIAPISGPTSGGSVVLITGTNFTSPMTVTFGGTPASNVVVLNSTTIQATTPARSAGTATVQVKSADGATAVGSLSFAYIAAAQPGTILSGDIPTSGAGLFVFGGGTNEQLVDLGEDEGCPAVRLSFFATNNGRFVAFLPAAPDFVNSAWNALFDDGIPARQPLVAVCR